MKSNEITLKGHFEERTSNEGNKYKVLILQLTDDYNKEIYISRAEKALLDAINKNDIPFNFN